MKKTQEQVVKSHLEKHKSITSWTAFEKYGITRLAARIFNLRDSGVNIKSENVTKNKKTFTKYTLSDGRTKKH